MAMRISALLGLMYALLILISVFVPLLYGQPLDFGFRVDDIIPAISFISLLAGALLALFRHSSSVLVAAWSWSFALQASHLVRLMAHPSDFSAAIAKAGNAAEQASMRQLFERAALTDMHIQLAYCTVALIGLILVLIGSAESDAPQKTDAV
jgi:hypothetical protein